MRSPKGRALHRARLLQQTARSSLRALKVLLTGQNARNLDGGARVSCRRVRSATVRIRLERLEGVVLDVDAELRTDGTGGCRVANLCGHRRTRAPTEQHVVRAERHQARMLRRSGASHGSAARVVERETIQTNGVQITPCRPIAAATRGDDVAVEELSGAARLEQQRARIRSLWDRETIQLGVAWLEQSAAGDVFSRFHAEPGIAAEHCFASAFQPARCETAPLPGLARYFSRRSRISFAYGAQRSRVENTRF
jgi:hypothetical protein